MKLKAKFIIPLAALLAGGYFFYDYHTSAKIKEIPYKSFCELVEGGTVAAAKIAEGEVFFEDADGNHFKTQNPESPFFKEFLLRNGVSVKSEKSAAQTISLALDILFYGIFALVIFTAFRKFISPNTFKVVRKTGVKFSDVVGMDQLKRDMAQVMQMMKNPERWEKKGVRLPKGILLEGEPGNGKTLFAKALAGEASVSFIPAKATDFESMFMAIGPLKVKLLFAKARRRAPWIVFIDEFDGIGTRRNYSGSAIETENTRIVTALLNELDGFEPTKGVLVVAATNSIQALDPALIRPGRFDARFKVPYPDMAARVQLVQKYTKAKNRAASCTDQKLAQVFDGFSCAKIESVLNKAALLSSQAGRSEFTLDDVEAAIRAL